MDALSDVLGVIRLTGAVFLEMELRAQWSYLTAPARKIADVLMPDADHVIPYHLLMEGTCFARLLDGEFVELAAGDLVMFPAGDRHVLATASDVSRQLEPTEITGESLEPSQAQRDRPVQGGRARQRDAHRVRLSRVRQASRRADHAQPAAPAQGRACATAAPAAWVRSSIQYSVAQSASQRPGSAMVLARLSEVLFAEAIRQHMDTLPPEETGWLAALRDRYVGRTLALLHEQARASVDRRRARAARSGCRARRSGQRFAALIGTPPMEYLMRWRILLAAKHLRESRRAGHRDRGRGRLRIGSRVQSRFQARVRRAARRVAAAGGQSAVDNVRQRTRPFRPSPSACP